MSNGSASIFVCTISAIALVSGRALESPVSGMPLAFGLSGYFRLHQLVARPHAVELPLEVDQGNKHRIVLSRIRVEIVESGPDS